MKGTLIKILHNNIDIDIPIEELTQYHIVKTRNGYSKIKFILKDKTDKIDFFTILKQNCFSDNKPNKDLCISKTHGLLFNQEEFDNNTNESYYKVNYDTKIDGLKKLIVKHCKKYDGNFLFEAQHIEYYNIELDSDERHCIYANNIEVESFYKK